VSVEGNSKRQAPLSLFLAGLKVVLGQLAGFSLRYKWMKFPEPPVWNCSRW